LPNIPHPSVKEGDGESTSGDYEVRRWENLFLLNSKQNRTGNWANDWA